MKNIKLITILLFVTCTTFAQQNKQDATNIYKKRALESTEIDLLASYYMQDGDNAAVCGGRGTEKLTDIAPAILISIPLNDDDILTIDAGISAYTSASTANINPFDADTKADPFVESSGASTSNLWSGGSIAYNHNSDDRNNIETFQLSFSKEFDYFSFGASGSYTRLFNEKNTEISINANIFLDTWTIIYPIELEPFETNGTGLNSQLFTNNTTSNISKYNPSFVEINNTKRNSYAIGLGFSQILSKKMQASLSADFVIQDGLLSTPFQRVYFNDIDNYYIDNFHLADDIERLPNTRFKIAIGSRLHYYINEIFVVRIYYRYYFDDWDINSHTASIEIPIKIANFTLYPSYRFYNQTKANYFAPYEKHYSTDKFYTSDYDLSEFSANQFGFGVTYTDILTRLHIIKFGLKSIDLKFHQYTRNSGLSAFIISGGLKFVID